MIAPQPQCLQGSSNPRSHHMLQMIAPQPQCLQGSSNPRLHHTLLMISPPQPLSCLQGSSDPRLPIQALLLHLPLVRRMPTKNLALVALVALQRCLGGSSMTFGRD